MREYPVGSVCIVIKAHDAVEMIGKEVTITEPLSWRTSVSGLRVWQGYGTDVAPINGIAYTPAHDLLRLKKLPPDEAFDKFLNKLKQPVEETV